MIRNRIIHVLLLQYRQIIKLKYFSLNQLFFTVTLFIDFNAQTLTDLRLKLFLSTYCRMKWLVELPAIRFAVQSELLRLTVI